LLATLVETSYISKIVNLQDDRSPGFPQPRGPHNIITKWKEIYIVHIVQLNDHYPFAAIITIHQVASNKQRWQLPMPQVHTLFTSPLLDWLQRMKQEPSIRHILLTEQWWNERAVCISVHKRKQGSNICSHCGHVLFKKSRCKMTFHWLASS
jgi:hypothetical protein